MTKILIGTAVIGSGILYTILNVLNFAYTVAAL